MVSVRGLFACLSLAVLASARHCLHKGDPTGLKYSGQRKQSASGKDCRSWKSAVGEEGPNDFILKISHLVANEKDEATRSISGMRRKFRKNKKNCRNYNNDPNGPWCFLEVGGWEYCDIPQCEPSNPQETCYQDDGRDYRGDAMFTEKLADGSHGPVCMQWTQRYTHGPNGKMGGKRGGQAYQTAMEEQGAFHNKCRNYRAPPGKRGTQGDYMDRPWCFTGKRTWAYCDVPKCGSGSDREKPTEPKPNDPKPAQLKCGIRKPKSKRTRITNGIQAVKSEFPWQIGIRDMKIGRNFCGGTILNKDWILTAAHCVIEDGQLLQAAQDLGIAVGWHNRFGTGDKISDEDRALGTDFIQVKSIITHEDYDSDLIFNDIALLELSRPIDFSNGEDSNVRPICLPSKQITEEKVKNSDTCVVSGWGDTKGDDDVDDRYLVWGEVPLQDDQSCDIALGGGQLEPQGTNICAQSNPDRVDTCQGDSGGPLVCESNGVYSQVGVTSWGFKCGGKYPGVYTEVSLYLDWIEGILKQGDGDQDLQYVS